MNSRVTSQYWQLLRALPNSVRRAARRAYRRFHADPQHQSLRFKKLNTKRPIWSARINNDYRAMGVYDGDTIVWFWIGSHEEYDKIIKSL